MDPLLAYPILEHPVFLTLPFAQFPLESPTLSELAASNGT